VLTIVHAGPDTHNDVHRESLTSHQEGHLLTVDILRVFDLTSSYGPCVGITRLQRWERAHKWGLNPPPEVSTEQVYDHEPTVDQGDPDDSTRRGRGRLSRERLARVAGLNGSANTLPLFPTDLCRRRVRHPTHHAPVAHTVARLAHVAHLDCIYPSLARRRDLQVVQYGITAEKAGRVHSEPALLDSLSCIHLYAPSMAYGLYSSPSSSSKMALSLACAGSSMRGVALVRR